jgi:hypothetical protein
MKKAVVQVYSCPLHAHNCIRHFTVYIQLHLFRGSISHPHWLRPSISLQPWEFAFRQMPFAAHPVHDLEASRIAPNGLN